MIIGILALQGAFIEHAQMLEKLDVDYFFIRNLIDLDRNFDGLILPGGESTAMGKLLLEFNMVEQLNQLITSGLPVFATCAGMILLAKKIHSSDTTHLETMNIEVVRNGYGRQLGSFSTDSHFEGIGQVKMRFIRAPYISSVGNDVKTLSVVDGRIVAARQGKQLAVSFHPELTNDLSIHKHFIEML